MAPTLPREEAVALVAAAIGSRRMLRVRHFMEQGEKVKMRGAVYARRSTDRESEDKPADQIARCRDFAKARG